MTCKGMAKICPLDVMLGVNMTLRTFGASILTFDKAIPKEFAQKFSLMAYEWIPQIFQGIFPDNSC